MTPSDALADLFAHHPDPIFIADGESALLHLSQPLAALLGPAGKAGTRLADRVHPDDRGAFDAAWARLREGAEAARFELRIEGADGAYRLASCSARRSPGRGDVHGSLRELGPVEVEARVFRALLEHLPIIVWAVDRSGVFIFQEGSGLAAMGQKPRQLLGMNLFELYGAQASRADFEKILAGEFVHAQGVGEGVPVENWSFPVFDEAGGEVVSVVTVAFQLTEARRAEVELREKLALVERQQAVITALGTPILEVWEKVLTAPMIGVVDSGRAALLMENMLAQVSAKRARFAILDMTGVEAVDSSTAAHLLKLVQAIRLLGAEGVITGIQPDVAQTMVTLGVNLESIVTCANLMQGLRHCVRQMREEPAPGR